ncbi:unnamed protein product [Protopolystoma xenopodis]|uniref:Uncharacterized protein n=1 Tax=Protopolystoma xenopodis TaxID=117903 RepID=A0A448XH38_9PLAT|nr:unnamed protein product [Protopolystoma xenopodis]
MHDRVLGRNQKTCLDSFQARRTCFMQTDNKLMCSSKHSILAASVLGRSERQTFGLAQSEASFIGTLSYSTSRPRGWLARLVKLRRVNNFSVPVIDSKSSSSGLRELQTQSLVSAMNYGAHYTPVSIGGMSAAERIHMRQVVVSERAGKH